MTSKIEEVHDIVVLGGGSGGYACALRAAQLGLSVVLIERDRLGGTCLHRGCIPTKAMLHGAEIADAAASGAAIGIHAPLQKIDMKELHAFKDGIVQRLYKGLSGLISGAGIKFVQGEGRVVAPNAVSVAGVVYSGRHLVIATGATPRQLPGIDLTARVLDSDGALALTRIPRRVVVIGGSVIGVEFASMWRSLGSDVTVIEALPSLVPLEDPAIGRELERAFRRRGIGVRTGVSVGGVVESATGALVYVAGGESVAADIVLVAVGRVPCADQLGLDQFGIQLDRGAVVVDDRLHTSVPGVWAVGDVVPGLQLAHRGFAHGIFVAEEIAGLDPIHVVDREIPRVTYCDPEIASVGVTEAEAREMYTDIEVHEFSLAGNGKSQILGTGGLVKIVRELDGPIVGIHMIGTRMGEQIGEATLVVGWEALPDDVARFIHAHPTQNEALGEAALTLAGRPLHTHA